MKRGFSVLLSLLAVLLFLGPAAADQGASPRADGVVVAAADCPCGPECKCDHKDGGCKCKMDEGKECKCGAECKCDSKDGCKCQMGEGKECKCGAECKCDSKDGCKCGHGGHKG